VKYRHAVVEHHGMNPLHPPSVLVAQVFEQLELGADLQAVPRRDPRLGQPCSPGAPLKLSTHHATATADASSVARRAEDSVRVEVLRQTAGSCHPFG
jgi:hypothetical protein